MKTVLAANVVLLALVGWAFASEYARNRGLKEEVDGLQRQAAELQAQAKLSAADGNATADQEMIEREARLKLGLQKPGEQVVVIKGLRAAPADGSVSTASSVGGDEPAAGPPPVTSKDNAQKWLAYFFR